MLALLLIYTTLHPILSSADQLKSLQGFDTGGLAAGKAAQVPLGMQQLTKILSYILSCSDACFCRAAASCLISVMVFRVFSSSRLCASCSLVAACQSAYTGDCYMHKWVLC